MSMSSSLEESIRKYTLLNAADHLGRASAQSIISKLLGDMPELRPQAKKIVELVHKEVSRVNAMEIQEQNALVKTLLPKISKDEKKDKTMTLPPLPNAAHYNKIVTRFSPNPDCVIHFGSTRALLLSHDYARQYNGKFILRFEDTDPRIKKPSLEFYDLIREDLRWLSCDWDEEVIQSDRLEIYYDYAEQLLLLKKGYVCTCSSDDFKNKIVRSKPCPCRDLEPEVNLERWHLMLTDMREGSAVYRIKTDLKHPNPAIRDWPALRIIDVKKYPHPRTHEKYRVWPLYNFASAIDDHLLQISHIIRGKEHQSNMIKQKYLYEYFGWKSPESIHYGRLKMDGVELSKSRILEGVHSGKYWGYDDPRLATLSALRRRGYQPSAIRRIIYDIGFKPVEVTVSWELLNSYNRKVVDSKSSRYSVVISPVEVVIKGIEGPLTVDLRKHPREKSMGLRRVQMDSGPIKIYIAKSDEKKVTDGQMVRLMGLMNILGGTKTGGKITVDYHSSEMDQSRKQKLDFINWVYRRKSITVEIMMPDGTSLSGLGEDNLKNEPAGTIIQLERVGFGRIDYNRFERPELAKNYRSEMTIFFTSK